MNNNSNKNMYAFHRTTQALEERFGSPYVKKKTFWQTVMPYILVMVFVILFHNIVSAIIDIQFMGVR